MPRPRFFRNKKRVPFKRQRKVVRRTNQWSLPSTGFPRNLAVKLRYCDVATLGASLGATDTWVFRCNSLFDPDVTNPGHQPYYFDQLSALYKRYRVNAIGWKAEFVNNSATVIARVGYTYSNDANTPSSTLPLNEAGDGKFRTLNIAGAGSGSSTVMKGYAKIKDLIGQGIDQSDLQATTASDPGLMHFLKIIVQDGTNGLNTSDVTVRISLMLYATMFSVDEVAQS